ncbi:unnamed protein product [Camellia sinensis]
MNMDPHDGGVADPPIIGIADMDPHAGGVADPPISPAVDMDPHVGGVADPPISPIWILMQEVLYRSSHFSGNRYGSSCWRCCRSSYFWGGSVIGCLGMSIDATTTTCGTDLDVGLLESISIKS